MGWLSLLNPKRILYALGALVLAFFVWQGTQFVQAKYAAERRADALEVQLKAREDTIKTLRLEAFQRKLAEDTANAVHTQTTASNAAHEDIRREAASAKEEDNGPVAPVLRRTLDALDGL